MNIIPGKKIVVSERGSFAPPFTACRFAEIAKQLRAQGYDVPLSRSRGADNFVHDLQVAGDPTPGNGSTLRQGQAAIRALVPDAEFFFGKITDLDMYDLVSRGATVSFAVDMGKMPHELRRFCGFGYAGGHYMGVDGVSGVSDSFQVDLSDPMYKPAKKVQTRRVAWADVAPAVLRSSDGQMIVMLSFVNSAFVRQQIAQAQADLATAQADLNAKTQALAALQAQHDAMVPA